MTETVREWVGKAEGDYTTARREVEVKDSPNYDAACFHAQQCIEKLMKALLISLGEVPPRTHDLIALGKLVAPLCKDWSSTAEDLRFLTRASVEFRYPGESAEKQDAQQALEIATRLRSKLRNLLGVQ